MKIILLTFGKTTQKWLAELEGDYIKKISKYTDIECVVIKEPTGHTRLSFSEQIKIENNLFEKKLMPGDFCIVMDEKGKQLNSVDFSLFMEKTSLLSYKRIVFIIGGPYGISETLKQKAGVLLALSALTFTHEMARVILLEQIYRSYNIINNTPYHHK